MKNSLLIILFTMAFLNFAQAQIERVEENAVNETVDPAFENVIWNPEYFYSNRKEIALDFTPLISKLIPFNLGQTERGLIGLKYKKYGRDIAFRVNFGADIELSNEENFAYLSLGYERRKSLTSKFSYTSGWDIFMSFVENSNRFGDDGAVGVARFYGFEYNFTDVFYMSTEAQLQISNAEGEVGLKMVIPEAIFIGARF